jgi:hypothetical protein
MSDYTFILIVIVVAAVGIAMLHRRAEDFKSPVDIPQPQGPEGWGYRDPVATFQTLMYEQNRPMTVIEGQAHPIPFVQRLQSVESAPVEKKLSPFEGTAARPVVPYLRPRPQATSNYANWA